MMHVEAGILCPAPPRYWHLQVAHKQILEFASRKLHQMADLCPLHVLIYVS